MKLIIYFVRGYTEDDRIKNEKISSVVNIFSIKEKTEGNKTKCKDDVDIMDKIYYQRRQSLSVSRK